MNYIDTPTFITYAAARGQTFDTAKAEIVLTKAMDFLKLQCWRGTKTDPQQENDWPRSGIPGVDETKVPAAVVDAQCRLAMAASKIDLLPSFAGGPAVIEETFQGVGTFKYAEATLNSRPSFPWMIALLSGLTCPDSSSGGINMRVRRG